MPGRISFCGAGRRGVLAGLDRDHVRRAAARCQRGLHPGDHLRGGHPPVQQQHLDQRPGARPVAVPGPGGGPERLMHAGERPRRAGLGQGGRAGQRAGLAHQDLQVVIQLEVLGTGRGQPRMRRHLLRPVEDAQLVRRQADPYPRVDQPGGHRIPAFAQAYPRIAVYPGPRRGRAVERLGGQRQQEPLLGSEILAHGGRPVADMPGVVGRVGLRQAGVQLGQRADLRDGDHPAAAEPPDLAFHTAFFMSSRLSRLTIERAEPVPGAEGQPPGGLGAAAAGQHLGHRG